MQVPRAPRLGTSLPLPPLALVSPTEGGVWDAHRPGSGIGDGGALRALRVAPRPWYDRSYGLDGPPLRTR